MVIAVFVSIPVVNLATPIFAMAFMVHIHKRMSDKRAELMRAAIKTRPSTPPPSSPATCTDRR